MREDLSTEERLESLARENLDNLNYILRKLEENTNLIILSRLIEARIKHTEKYIKKLRENCTER